jgi:hypothetical protein
MVPRHFELPCVMTGLLDPDILVSAVLLRELFLLALMIWKRVPDGLVIAMYGAVESEKEVT